jgi:hypothetical protein
MSSRSYDTSQATLGLHAHAHGRGKDRNSGFNIAAAYVDNDIATVMAENFSPALLAGKAYDMFATAWPLA